MSRLALAVLAALVVAAPAFAAYPGTYALQGQGTLAHGPLSFAASRFGLDTRISALDARSTDVVREATIDGAYGIPTLIPVNDRIGMFRDGTRFVLQSVSNGSRTSFVVMRTADLTVAQRISLGGSFALDAVAPDGSRLYLIQHRSADFGHYVVRAYDLRAAKLLPGRIADKAQQSWVMSGWPAARRATFDGRWVYTLYTNPRFPFVHALDTVKGVAHCVGIAWQGSQNQLAGYRLAIDGNRLLVLRPDGTAYRSIDRTTWAVSVR
jgi:hypothetical protein